MSLFFKKLGFSQKGFSLVELLVSISIMVAIITVVVFNQRSYTEVNVLNNMADTVALAVSEVQAYGLAVKETTPGSSDFDSGYGVSLSLLESGEEDGYISFIDRNNNHYYDGTWTCSSHAECVSKEEFSGGIYISSICVVRTSGSDQCNVARAADISFERPNLEAQIGFLNPGGSTYSPANLKGVRIVLMSPSGLSRSVVVYTTGQVSVE